LASYFNIVAAFDSQKPRNALPVQHSDGNFYTKQTKTTKNIGVWLGAKSPREPFLVMKHPAAKSINTGFRRPTLSRPASRRGAEWRERQRIAAFASENREAD
jgi:hypothetical protein